MAISHRNAGNPGARAAHWRHNSLLQSPGVAVADADIDTGESVLLFTTCVRMFLLPMML